MKCCTNIENLGCFDSCNGIVTTDLIADVAGVWSMEIDYMGITKKVNFEVFASGPLVMPLGGVLLDSGIVILTDKLNEDYEYIVRFYRPDGTLLNDTCYSFKIYKVVCN